MDRQSMSSLTTDQHNNFYPVWAPDGRHLVYESRWKGVHTMWWTRVDGGSEPQKLLEASNLIVPYSISPDGKRIAYYQVAPGAGNDIWTLPLDLSDPDRPKTGPPEQFLRSSANESQPAFSPDGHWMAYLSDESRPNQIFVRPFPPGRGKWQISRDGGAWPKFTRESKQIFYLAPDGHLMVVDYQIKGDSFVAGNPRVWSEATVGAAGTYAPYDVSSDGKRVATVPRATGFDEKGSVHVELLINFFDELRRRIP
jgi:serine/threonine-protein kinase